MKSKKHQFIEVIDQNKGIMRSLCQVYYANAEDRKDAFQDIVLQLWKSFETYREEAKISTWIYRVSLNTILSKKRKEKKSVVAVQLSPLHQNISMACVDDHTELLQLILQSLKDIDKAIVVLYLEGYRHKEIAEMLEMTPTNVTTRFNRIKTRLSGWNSEWNSNKKLNDQNHANKRP